MNQRRKPGNMAKKKKKKTSMNLLKEVDKSLENTYEDLMTEIQQIQLELNLKEKKAVKKQRKMLREDMGIIPYYTAKDRVKARMEAIEKIEEKNLLERVERCYKKIIPIVIVIARLVASLILSILSFAPVKWSMRPETLNKMNRVYQLSMAIR